MTSFLVMASTRAGKTTDAGLDEAVAVLRSAAEVEVVTSDGPGGLDEQLDARAGRPVVIAGGDGSVHAIMAALHRRGELAETPIGLLPLGTGNDFARALRLPLQPADAAGVILAGERRRVELLVADEPGAPDVVVNAAHVGAGAEAARIGARWKERLGRIGYPIGALITSVRPPAPRLEVEVDGAVIPAPHHGRRLQVAVGVGGSVGGGARLIPEAKPGDDLADVIVSSAITPLARLRYAASLLRGRQSEDPDVVSVRGHRIRVHGDPFWCSADGELSGPHTSLAWRVEPAAYEIFVPADAG